MSRLSDSALEGNLSTLADEWTEALLNDSAPAEMLEALQVLVSRGLTDDARLLAETAAEEMDTAGSPHTLDFVSGAAALLDSSPVVRRVLVEALRDANILYEPLEKFMEKSGLLRDRGSLKESWRKMEDLLKLRLDSFLYHPTYGPGKIARITRSAFTVDFQRSMDHDMTLEAVMETTRPVEEDSVFVMAWKDPGALKELLSSGGKPLLERAMKDLATAGKVTRSGLIELLDGTGLDPAEAWKSLAAAAKQTEDYILLGDQIFPGKGASTPERIRSILSERSTPLSEKARLVESLLASDAGVYPSELEPMIPLVFAGRCVEPGAAFELLWLLGGKSVPPRWADRASQLVETTSPRVLRALSEIRGNPCRKDYLTQYLRSSPDSAQLSELMDNLPRGLRQVGRDALKDSDPGFLAWYLADSLSDPSRVERHMWALEQAAEAGDMLPPDQITADVLKNLHRARSESQRRLCGILMNRLRPSFESHVAGLDTRRLERLADELDRLGSAHETGLLLVVRRQLNSRRLEGATLRHHFWETDAVFSSPDSIGKLHDEVKNLQQKEIPAAAEAIAEAAAHGDLSENAEYKAAMERRDLLLDTLDRQRTMLSRLRPYPEPDVSDRVVSPGTRVIIEALDDSGDCRVLGIVGPLDTRGEGDRINYQAPLGAALLGRSTGDTVTLPGDDRNWRISGISVMDEILS